MSWINCMEECEKIRKCKSVNYIRRPGFECCELNSADQHTNPEALKPEVSYVFSAKSEWGYTEPGYCSNCSENESCNLSTGNLCKALSCPDPEPLLDGTILGNLFHVGTKRVYRCANGAQEVRICQENGSWSHMSLKCTCSFPEIENASCNISTIGTGVYEAIISCNPGYFHQGVNKVQCNSSSLIWDNLEQVGCIKIYVEPWTIVYRTVAGIKTTTPVIMSWKQDNKQEAGEYRNDDIISNWGDKNIKSVRVVIIDEERSIEKYLLFDGADTDNMNWFALHKILSSSWTDLKKAGDVPFFKIPGVRIDPSGFLRWAILYADKEGGKNYIDCSNDLVWFAITLPNNYPCTPERDLSGRVIVYSKSGTGTTWEGGELGFATEIIVSVEFN